MSKHCTTNVSRCDYHIAGEFRRRKCLQKSQNSNNHRKTFACVTSLSIYEHTARVLYRNGFLGRKMVRGKCALGIGVWGLPPRKMLVCLYPSTSLRRCLLTGKSLLYAIILNCNLEKHLGRGKLECLGEKFSPTPVD